jgi:hypothetical protein
MGRYGLSAVLVLAGLSLVALSVAADAIGLGAADYAFGWEQKVGVALGMSVAWIAGLRLLGWTPSFARAKRPTQNTAPAARPVSA